MLRHTFGHRQRLCTQAPRVSCLCAGGLAEVRRRAAYVVDVALEIGFPRDAPCLADEALAAARLHDTPLVEGERAEAAFAETATVGDERHLYLGERGNAACRFVIRMRRFAHRGGRSFVQRFGGERLRGRVLHHEDAVRVGLNERSPLKGSMFSYCVLKLRA